MLDILKFIFSIIWPILGAILLSSLVVSFIIGVIEERRQTKKDKDGR